MKPSKRVLSTLALGAGVFVSAALAQEARVDEFSPQGEARAVRQVAVRFSAPMVALGDPRLPDPLSVRCDGDLERTRGRGRWADPKNWVYDFVADLPAGQRCAFTLVADLKSVAGTAVGGRREWSFHTGGPAVMTSLPRDGDESIDDEQAFVLALDAPLLPASAGDIWCEASGINERIPATLLPDADTQAILAANRDAAFRLYRAYFTGARGISYANFRIEDKRFRSLPVVGVRCARRLPADADVAVVLGAGVKSATGIARGREQRLAFKVRPPFAVRLSCDRISKEAACLPVTPIRLTFSAPVPRELAALFRLQSETGDVREPQLEADVATVDGVEFRGPFPERTRYQIALPSRLRDDAGREPDNKAAFPLATATDESPPLVKFPGRFGILELNAQPLLPVSVRGVERLLPGKRVDVGAAPAGKPIAGRSQRLGDETRIIQRFQTFLDNNRDSPARAALGKRYPNEGELSVLRDSDDAVAFELPPPTGDKALELIGIPLPKPGFYIVELASPRLGRALHDEDKPYYVSTSVLVTNLAVHLKHGREGSLVWVTSLDRGLPVAGADVSVRDCNGKLWFEGRTDGEGIAAVGDALPPQRAIPQCGNYRRELIAFAHQGDDVSFTYSTWWDGIQPWNFNLDSSARERAPVAVHTVFDRTLLKSGETVSMKHFARAPNGQGFALPPARRLPTVLEIEHVGSGEKVKLAAKFDAQGIAEHAWKIPAEAKLGSYRLTWPGREIEGDAEFRVEAFRVPLLRATLAAPKEPLVAPSTARFDAAVSYLSGGGAGGLPVKIRSRVEPRSVAFADLDGFRFGGSVPREGLRTGPATDAWPSFDPDQEPDATPATGPAAVRTLTLDAAGTGSVTIDRLPAVDRAASLVVEMEYADPTGEILTVATRAALHPAAQYIGIKPEGWAASKAAVRAQVVVVDPQGRPVAGRDVRVEVYESKTFSSRRRLLGGFYAYDSSTETRRVGSACSGSTDSRGLLFCVVKPGASGELILVARSRDDAGREATATTSVWVRGDGDWWFEPSDHDRIDLIPEKKRYEPGETARFQVRLPFREASVLVTVEREGVLAQRVVHLDGKSPVIEVPIVGSYGPNVFVSALAVRGRVDPEVPGPYAWLKQWIYRIGHWLGLVDEVPVEHDTRPTALVDLTKPAYKLGIAEIKVGRRAYELDVKVAADREAYRVRDTARVTIAVADSAGQPAAHGEVALAAVDEGLLELLDNTSWNLLDGILGERPIEVMTATAQGRVIGKRHFGRKAVPPGGGGGRGGSRELFETLLLWKARVPLDADGRAVVSVPLNDALTSFRIVAVAHAGADRFGTGRTTIRATQELMLLSGLPPVVREGDEFAALFTLRNTTAVAQSVALDWTLAARSRAEPGSRDVGSGRQALTIPAGQAIQPALPVKVPVGAETLQWTVAVAGEGSVRDRLSVAQQVVAAHPVTTLQATLVQLDRPWSVEVARPADAVPGRGGVRVEVMASLAGAQPGVRDYFARYPYACLEQRASRAIGLDDDALWAAVGGSLPNYLDGDGLARYFPTDALQGSDTLTAYLLQIADAADREWPDEALERMLTGLERFVQGKIVRGSALPMADLTVRKLAAIEALARHKRAKPALIDALPIDPPLWPTSALVDWIGILQRVDGILDRNTKLGEALGLLRARLTFQGTTMTFSTERTDALWWLMVSADVNANRALLAVLDRPEWRDDLPRLLRGTLARQQRGHWGTTVANAWGSVAVDRFARAVEKVPAGGKVTIALGERTEVASVGPKVQARELGWPATPSPLALTHAGAGAPWAIVQSRAAVPLAAPLTSGYAITRTVTPVEQKVAGSFSRGDVYRVTLDIDAQSDMTWVVVDDPVPSGAAILGSGLGRDAGSLARGEKREGWAWPAFVERGYTSYRAYYEFVPKGRFKLEYTARLNNAGRFDLPATRVEAMYSPESFGAAPNAAVAVAP